MQEKLRNPSSQFGAPGGFTQIWGYQASFYQGLEVNAAIQGRGGCLFPHHGNTIFRGRHVISSLGTEHIQAEC